MWKITRLYLKNFIHIYAGMNKREVILDLSKCDKRINIFIGKMGSGKSSILGHLQPFSTYGTLDIRNQESLVIPGEDGLKEIDYLHNGHVYTIQHKYSWNKSLQNHATKSYIQMDGNELNENGNTRSFKEIIRTEFGIDQNFLRLLRLGPNVANLINMKSTERKSFVASLLRDSEVYAMLYQKLSEDYRNMNSALSVLSNKLVGLSSERENEMKAELEDLDETIDELLKKMDHIKESIAKKRGANQTLCNNEQPDQLIIHADLLDEQVKESQKKVEEITETLENLPKEGMQEISMRFGEVSAKLIQVDEEILKLQDEYTQVQADRNRLRDFLLIQKNDEQLEKLATEATQMQKKYLQAQEKLNGFHSSYSYQFLTSFVDTIQNFQMSLEDMCTNSKEVIGKTYGSDASITTWAKKKLEKLIGRQVNLQKLLSNIKFSAEYSSPIPLYRPPMCPTMDCPFIQTHPEMIKYLNADHRESRIVELKNQLDALEKEISVCEDYISQYPKMQYLKKLWESIYPVLDRIGALEESNLYKLLTNLEARCNWYSYERLIDVTEKAQLQESFAQLQNQYYQIQSELMSLKDPDIEKKESDLAQKEKASEEILTRLGELQISRQSLAEEKTSLEKTLLTLEQVDSLEKDREVLNQLIRDYSKTLKDLNERIAKVSDNIQRIKSLENEVALMGAQYLEKNNRATKIRMILQDIASTKSSYQEYLDERNVIKLILDAVSSKEGIPLIMVKSFLDECKEIINDLISDIFEDDLEIAEFDLSEDSQEFKIPFKINGTYVSDIELASQGQQAVISIALSFALCRKSMFDYNIMLLDEIDNSIHKTDRERFIMILAKQMRALGTEQVFLITHNDIFQQSGLPVNIIMTTNENIDSYPNQSIMQLY